MSRVPVSESGERTPNGVSGGLALEAGNGGQRASKFGHRALLLAIVVFSFLGSYEIQKRIDHAFGPNASQHEELTFLPSESRVPRLAGGYSGLVAAIYWTRAVQYYGRHRLAHAKEFSLLGTLLDTATNLDPHLLVAYRFGSLFLAGKPPEGAGDPQRAIYLLQRGIVANPDYWRLWEDLGFIYYWDMKDYARAARAFQAGADRPGAMPWMRVMAASVAAQGGEVQTSRILWSELAHSTENEQIRRTAELHVAVLDAEDALRKLDGLIAVYSQKVGLAPSSFQQMVAAGYLRGIPLDSSGEPFVIGVDGHPRLGPKSRIDLALGQ